MNFENWIDEKVRDKKVLEIGGIGDYKRYARDEFSDWRHSRLRQIAKSLVGGDISHEGIDCVNSYGFNYIYFDIENTNISEKTGIFQRILLLDVIEHLNNIGKSLENIKNYMDSESEFIISTPNPMALNNVARVLLGKKVNTFEDHTVWIDETNMQQFATRYGYTISETHYITFQPIGGGVKQTLINFIGDINKYFRQNIVFVLRKGC